MWIEGEPTEEVRDGREILAVIGAPKNPKISHLGEKVSLIFWKDGCWCSGALLNVAHKRDIVRWIDVKVLNPFLEKISYQVLEDGKPADCYHHSVHKSWRKSSFDTLREAQEYAGRPDDGA